MTYSDRSRDDERRRQEERRKADERRRKAAQQKAIDDRRRAELAKQAQQKKKQQFPKPTNPQKPSNLPKVNPSNIDPQAGPDSQLQQPQPKKEASFWDRAANFGGRVVEGAKNFGSGFVWQFAENQATTTAGDLVNPKEGKRRRNWMAYQGLTNPEFAWGQRTADVVNILQGFGQMTIGGVSMGGGTVISGTGAGALVGAPAMAGGAVIAGTGAMTAQKAMSHLMMSSQGGENQAQREPDSKDRIQHEEHKKELRRDMEAPHIEDSELSRFVDRELYREGAEIGSGSTADAIRYELKTGQRVKGKLHSIKGRNAIKYLNDWLRDNPTARPGDRAAAQNILRDLKNAFGEDW
jgi:hypothetical protein